MIAIPNSAVPSDLALCAKAGKCSRSNSSLACLPSWFPPKISWARPPQPWASGSFWGSRSWSVRFYCCNCLFLPFLDWVLVFEPETWTNRNSQCDLWLSSWATPAVDQSRTTAESPTWFLAACLSSPSPCAFCGIHSSASPLWFWVAIFGYQLSSTSASVSPRLLGPGHFWFSSALFSLLVSIDLSKLLFFAALSSWLSFFWTGMCTRDTLLPFRLSFPIISHIIVWGTWPMYIPVFFYAFYCLIIPNIHPPAHFRSIYLWMIKLSHINVCLSPDFFVSWNFCDFLILFVLVWDYLYFPSPNNLRCSQSRLYIFCFRIYSQIALWNLSSCCPGWISNWVDFSI